MSPPRTSTQLTGVTMDGLLRELAQRRECGRGRRLARRPPIRTIADRVIWPSTRRPSHRRRGRPGDKLERKTVRARRSGPLRNPSSSRCRFRLLFRRGVRRDFPAVLPVKLRPDHEPFLNARPSSHHFSGGASANPLISISGLTPMKALSGDASVTYAAGCSTPPGQAAGRNARRSPRRAPAPGSERPPPDGLPFARP